MKEKETRKALKKKKNCTKLAPVLPLSGVENSLLALETVLPMSAKERRLDFLVWWRCFLSKVYMTFSFRSAFKRPLSIWLSVIISERERKKKWQTVKTSRQWERKKKDLPHACFTSTELITAKGAIFLFKYQLYITMLVFKLLTTTWQWALWRILKLVSVKRHIAVYS